MAKQNNKWVKTDEILKNILNCNDINFIKDQAMVLSEEFKNIQSEKAVKANKFNEDEQILIMFVSIFIIISLIAMMSYIASYSIPAFFCCLFILMLFAFFWLLDKFGVYF